MKKFLSVILVSLMLFSFVSCGGENITSGSSMPDLETESNLSSAPLLNKNPLSGVFDLEDSQVGKRPVGIMINNIKASLPQRGISQADIYYEVLAEGGITRILAMFSDMSAIPDTGSLRSARYYFLALAMGHNAIFCHFGGEKYALEYIKNNNIKTINFISSNASYRDKNRVGKYSYEHTAFTDGARLEKAAKSKGIAINGTTQDAFKFGDNDAILIGGNAAFTVTVPFSSSYKSQFTYNAETGFYDKQNYVSKQFVDHIDEATGKALSVKNVFVLQTTINLKDANSKKNYIDVDLNSGNGYYACDGKVVPISWKKGGNTDMLKYYTLDGKELVVKPGKSYVCIAPVTSAVSYN